MLLKSTLTTGVTVLHNTVSLRVCSVIFEVSIKMNNIHTKHEDKTTKNQFDVASLIFWSTDNSPSVGRILVSLDNNSSKELPQVPGNFLFLHILIMENMKRWVVKLIYVVPVKKSEYGQGKWELSPFRLLTSSLKILRVILSVWFLFFRLKFHEKLYFHFSIAGFSLRVFPI